MKKFFSLVLALVMALSLTTVAWGEPDTTWPTGTTVDGVTTVELTNDVELSAPVTIAADTIINGNGHTLTYTGTDRAITVESSAAGADLTINDLTIVATGANRGINYNTYGKLTLNNVKVTAATTADGYAINMPGSSDNAVVEINNSVLVGRIALNIWGTDATITVTNSSLSSIEDDDQFAYSAIQLNCEADSNGVMGNSADGTVVNVIGGDINGNGSPAVSVSNWTSTGKVNISGTTDVTGETLQYVALIGGVGYTSLEDASAEATTGQTIVVLPAASAQGDFTAKAGVTYKGLGGTTLTPSAAGTITPPAAGFVNNGKYDLYDANGDLYKENITVEYVEAYDDEGAGNIEYYKLTWDGVTYTYFIECSRTKAECYLTLADNLGAYKHLKHVDYVDYVATGKAYTNIGDDCGELDVSAKAKAYVVTDKKGVSTYYVGTTTGEVIKVGNELVVVTEVVDGLVPHVWVVTAYNDDAEPITAKCKNCPATGKLYATKLAAPVGATFDATQVAGYWVVVNGTAAAEGDKVESAETFDAGIAMYVGMSVLAATGSAVVLKKRER